MVDDDGNYQIVFPTEDENGNLVAGTGVDEDGNVETGGDPLPFAALDSINIDPATGRIVGISKDTDEVIVIGYIAIGNVTNPNGVTHIGDSYYKAMDGAGDLTVTLMGGAEKTAAFLENMESPRAGIAFGMMRNGEGREWAELTDEAIAKIGSGNFTFGGKGFKGMAGKKPENMGSFKPEMPAFDGKNFKDMGGKPGGRPELTDEQKAALMENIKSSLGDDFPAGKLMPIKNAVPGMPGRAIKPAVTAEQ